MPNIFVISSMSRKFKLCWLIQCLFWVFLRRIIVIAVIRKIEFEIIIIVFTNKENIIAVVGDLLCVYFLYSCLLLNLPPYIIQFNLSLIIMNDKLRKFTLLIPLFKNVTQLPFIIISGRVRCCMRTFSYYIVLICSNVFSSSVWLAVVTKY